MFATLSTLDLACRRGADIHGEARPPEEVTEKWHARRMAPEGVKALNPAFDAADAERVTAIVTEKGIARAPYGESLRRLKGA